MTSSVAAVSTEGLEVVLLVDASRSGHAAGGGPVISAAVEFVLRLNEASVGIVGFGGEPEVPGQPHLRPHCDGVGPPSRISRDVPFDRL